MSTKKPDLERELVAIRQSLDNTLELSRMLLALRLVKDGHAADLRHGVAIARDIDQVRKLYPIEED